MKLLNTLSLLIATVRAKDVLPPTTGPYSVANKVVPLVDEKRWDALAPEDKPQKRNILIDMYIPFDGPCKAKAQPFFPPQTEVAVGKYAESLGLPADIVAGFEIEYCTLPDESKAKNNTQLPVILFSPGLQGSRLYYAAQARSLASYGYLVITVDYPFETLIVEFPNNTTYVAEPLTETNPAMTIKYGLIRAEDASFIIDKLPDLVTGLPTRFDTTKVLAYGHSLGGHTAAQTALTDPRVVGAMDIDGALWSPVAEQGLDIPYVFLLSEHTNTSFPDILEPWSRFRGPKLLAKLNGTEHSSFIDFSLLLEVRGVPEELKEAVARWIGTIKGSRMEEVVRSIVVALADFVFVGDSSGLFGLNDEFEELEVPEIHVPDN